MNSFRSKAGMSLSMKGADALVNAKNLKLGRSPVLGADASKPTEV